MRKNNMNLFAFNAFSTTSVVEGFAIPFFSLTYNSHLNIKK